MFFTFDVTVMFTHATYEIVYVEITYVFDMTLLKLNLL